MSIFREIFGVISFKDKASDAIDKVDSKMDASKAKAIGLQGAMQAIGGAYFIKKTFDVVGSLVELSAQMEDTTTSFEVMLGSAEAAKSMMNDLIKFSDVTPFEDMQITDAAKMLMNFGIAANDVMPSIQMLGDVSGGNAEKFSRLSLAFGQVSSQGKLMGQDLLQMINAGFNPLQEMSKTTGKSMAQLKDEMSKGLVSFEMVRNAFMSATGEGGRFHDMMKKQAETWHGLISTFNGLRNSVLRSIGDILQKALKPLLKGLIQILQTFVAWAKTEKGMAILKTTMVALVPVIGTLMVGAVWSLAAAFWGLLAPLMPILGTALLVGAAFGLLFLIFEDIYTYFQGGESYFGDFMKYLGITREEINIFVKDIRELLTEVKDFAKTFGKDFVGAIKVAAEYTGKLVNALKELNAWFNKKTDINVAKNIGKNIVDMMPVIGTIKNIADTKKQFNELQKDVTVSGVAKFTGEQVLNLLPPAKIVKNLIKDATEKRQSGGDVEAGKPYIVGERGRELFIPGSTGQIMPNNSLGGVTIKQLVGSINITVQNADEGIEVIKSKILDALNELSSSVFPAAAGVVM